MTPDHELSGVRLGDVYRDKEGNAWEVYALCDQPTASVRRLYSKTETTPVGTVDHETHVIGCLNWKNKWATGPLREVSVPLPAEEQR